jgi:RNA polymerase sigma factor (sigma-70 family)
MITITTIRAAQNNDMAAIAEVVEATEPTITRLAGKAAQRMNGSFADYREEFAQVGRAVMWEALKRFAGETEAEFFGFTIKTVESALYDAVRSEKNGGAGIDKDAVWVFSTMLAKADGDPYKAAKLAQTEPPKGDRLSADRADAARLAYQGAASLDAPVHGDADAPTLAETIVSTYEIEAVPVVRPKVGLGAAVEALRVVIRYTPLRLSLAGLSMDDLPDLVPALEESVTLPRDEMQRRYVLDAFAILRSAVSTATDGDLVEELRDVADDRQDERAEKHGRVALALGKLGALQRDVICHSFGIGDVTCFGYGTDGDASGLAELLGKTQVQITDARRKAYRAFAKAYASLHSAERAAELEAAFAGTRRVKGGRK